MASEDKNQLGSVGGDLEQLPEIRRVFEEDIWYYNITDVIAALTGTSDSSDYWLKMKRRGKSEGFEETLKKDREGPWTISCEPYQFSE